MAIWGWQIQRESERVNDKYIEWVLKIDREIPVYMYMMNTGEDKMEIKARVRIVIWD